MARTILITGASGGIGAATAHAFLDAGWRVGLIGRNEAKLRDVASAGGSALVLPCDVTDPDAVNAAVGKAAKDWGRVDALFNNAGISLQGKTPDQISDDEWLGVMNTNINGMFFAARAAFAQMKAQEPNGGRIINNGSVSAYVPRWGSMAYTTSKHAVTGMTRSLSLDGRPFSIACGQIDIGNALTDMAASMVTGMPQADGEIRVEPVMDVTHVASSVLHMASLPLEANVQFMTVMASAMPYIGRG